MPEDAKIGCVMLSAARATPGVCRRGRRPWLCSPVFHTCVCSFLVLPLFILILERCSSSDASSTNSSFLSAAGHAVLGTEDSRSPRHRPARQMPVPEIWRRRMAAPPGAPPGPRLARSPSSAAPGWDAGERAGTTRTRPKVCKLSTCPLGYIH